MTTSLSTFNSAAVLGTSVDHFTLQRDPQADHALHIYRDSKRKSTLSGWVHTKSLGVFNAIKCLPQAVTTAGIANWLGVHNRLNLDSVDYDTTIAILGELYRAGARFPNGC